MMLRMNKNLKSENFPATAGLARPYFRASIIASVVLFAALPASYMLRSQTPSPSQSMPGSEANRQIAGDSAKLLKLATDLKAEVDKTSKDTLSLGVIRKADEIEKLAHAVKEKIKLSIGGN